MTALFSPSFTKSHRVLCSQHADRLTSKPHFPPPQVLLRFLGADEFEGSDLPPSRLSWMTETPVLQRLLGQLSPEATLDTQQNAAYVLSGIARSHLSPLAQALAGPDCLSQLLERAFAPNVSSLVRGHPMSQDCAGGVVCEKKCEELSRPRLDLRPSVDDQLGCSCERSKTCIRNA